MPELRTCCPWQRRVHGDVGLPRFSAAWSPLWQQMLKNVEESLRFVMPVSFKQDNGPNLWRFIWAANVWMASPVLRFHQEWSVDSFCRAQPPVTAPFILHLQEQSRDHRVPQPQNRDACKPLTGISRLQGLHYSWSMPDNNGSQSVSEGIRWAMKNNTLSEPNSVLSGH